VVVPPLYNCIASDLLRVILVPDSAERFSVSFPEWEKFLRLDINSLYTPNYDLPTRLIRMGRGGKRVRQLIMKLSQLQANMYRAAVVAVEEGEVEVLVGVEGTTVQVTTR
jgi:hypothetical protein